MMEDQMLELNTRVIAYYAQNKEFQATAGKIIGRSFSSTPIYDVLLDHGAVLRNMTPDNLEIVEKSSEKICEICHGNHYVTLGDGKTKMCEACYVD
jgi:hypothetical protein